MQAFRSVLLLGGAGFIATHFARHLLDEGLAERVFSVDIRDPEDPVRHVVYRKHDVRQPFDDLVTQPIDAVFNFAAVHRTPGHPDWEYFDTNVAGALNCVRFCEQNNVRTLVFTSSIAVYGKREEALTETSVPTPNTAYGRSKLLAEGIHREWMGRAAARRLVIVRPSVVFGTGERGNFTRLARQLAKGFFAYPGRNDTRKAAGYVKELTRSMIFALERPEPSYLYNFADPRCSTSADICNAFCRVSNAHHPLGVVPLPFMKAAASALEFANLLGFKNDINRSRIDKLVHSTHIRPQRLISDGYTFRFDLTSALRDWISEDASLGLRLRSPVKHQVLPATTTSESQAA